MLQISVADNGPGMDPAKISALFAATVGPIGKSDRGFGLATSLVIVKAMEGHLVCRSQLKSGTNFAILLPRRLATEPGSALH